MTPSVLSPLEQLTFGLAPKSRAALGEQGELRRLSLSALFIDPDYQRRILDSGKANIRRMIEEFSWQEFGVLTVSRRGGGRYAIIDGQHRATAAMLHGGIKDVPCLIHGMTPVEEARTFSAMNSQVTRIHTLQTFRAKVAAGDVAACELVRICALAKTTIAPYPKPALEPGESMALGSLRLGFNNFGQPVFVPALKLLRAASPESGLPAPAILGACATLKDNKDWRGQAASLGDKLADRGGLEKLMERAVKRKASYGGVLWRNFATVLTDTISMSLRQGGNMKLLMAGR